MTRILTVTAAIALMIGIVCMFPPDLFAEEDTTCNVRATKPVYVEARYSEGGRKAPTIRRKSGVIWSGNLNRGGVISVTVTNGWVHLTYSDLTKQDPRSEIKKRICKNGNTILIPR